MSDPSRTVGRGVVPPRVLTHWLEVWTMSESDTRTCEEDGCSRHLLRKRATGRWPRFCPECLSRRTRARLAEKSRKWRAAHKPPREPVKCSECPAMIEPAANGPLPTRCESCARRRTLVRNAEYRRKATQERQAQARWADCQDEKCGARFQCAAKGPIPKWCPTCKPAPRRCPSLPTATAVASRPATHHRPAPRGSSRLCGPDLRPARPDTAAPAAAARSG